MCRGGVCARRADMVCHLRGRLLLRRFLASLVCAAPWPTVSSGLTKLSRVQQQCRPGPNSSEVCRRLQTIPS